MLAVSFYVFWNMLTLHFLFAAKLLTGNFFLLTCFVVDLYTCVCAFLSTMLAAVVSVGAVVLQMCVKYLPHELLNFVAVILTFFGTGK